MSRDLSFSIIITTDGRRDALAKALRSLPYLDYPQFEVCVVHGPTPDGTDELLASWKGQIKVAGHPVRDLSIARNIGIALASGEILAFLDDDAIPEPGWLTELAGAYDDSNVGGAGGFVYDATGVSFQCRYVTLNRLGAARDWEQPAPELNFPLSAEFPHLLGTNCSFRRDALLAIGGFDEQIGRYLDESDVCCRMIDQGWLLKQVAGGCVHHKLLPDAMRSERRIIRQWYHLFKNKLYFPLVSGRKHHTLKEIIVDAQHFTKHFAEETQRAIEEGYLPGNDGRRFREELLRGWRDGLHKGLAGERRLLTLETINQHKQPFLPFPSTVPGSGRKTFCLLTQDYPPARLGGIARSTHQLARSLAALGHHVHVLTKGTDRDRVDFEDSAWVHRLVPVEMDQPVLPDGIRVPKHIWNYAATMLREIKRIGDRRRVDGVYAPLWDCEGLAVLLDGLFPLVTSLQTPLHFFLKSNPQLESDGWFMSEFGRPMLALEKLLLQRSSGFRANSSAIVTDIEDTYGVSLPPQRLTVAPHGLEDWSGLPAEPPKALPDGSVRILFVGRLEPRKGIDVLLEVAGNLIPRHERVYFDIVGNDTIAGADGRPHRVVFECDASNAGIRDRVRFHGEVTDEALRGFYRACDIFVAPSRYESFGLVLLEAMMFAKPVIGCRAGGMAEVIEDGKTGLLAEAGDSASLKACLELLVGDAALRLQMGAAGRKRYEERFTPDRMARSVVDLLSATASLHTPRTSANSAPLTQGGEVHLVPGEAARARHEHICSASLPVRIALVVPQIVRFDAISTAARHTIRALRQEAGYELTVLTSRSDFPDIPVEFVRGVGELLLHPAFLAADLVIYRFGIYNPFFDSMLANRHARQIVGFHNITPVEFAPAEYRTLIEDSFRQLFNLRSADRIWADSGVNAAVLKAHGFDPSKIEIIPLAVERPPIAALAIKPTRQVELLFVGRMVPSKGVLDLIEAADLARRRCDVPFRLRLVGNLEFSNPAYVERIKRAIAERGMSCAQFVGTVDDKTLIALYLTAHIQVLSSYHEGFAVPVVEALRAGCIPVGYAAYNLAHIANRLGRMVPTGNRVALASALVDVINGVAMSNGQPDAPFLPLDCGRVSRNAFDKAARSYVANFTFDRMAGHMLRSIREVLDLP